MSEERFRNVEHRVGNLENESVRDGKAIERLKKEDAVLENDISTILLLLENFFVWPSSAPRYGDAQNAAFDKIRELLKEMRQRYPLVFSTRRWLASSSVVPTSNSPSSFIAT